MISASLHFCNTVRIRVLSLWTQNSCCIRRSIKDNSACTEHLWRCSKYNQLKCPLWGRNLRKRWLESIKGLKINREILRDRAALSFKIEYSGKCAFWHKIINRPFTKLISPKENPIEKYFRMVKPENAILAMRETSPIIGLKFPQWTLSCWCSLEPNVFQAGYRIWIMTLAIRNVEDLAK